MGLDLRRPSLTCGRALVVACLAVVALAGPAVAEDPTPAPGPSQVPTLAPPSQQQIDDARSALARLQGATDATPTTLTRVAGAVDARGRASVAPRISDQAWWTVGAALMVVLVLTEATRISVRRAKHRKA